MHLEGGPSTRGIVLFFLIFPFSVFYNKSSDRSFSSRFVSKLDGTSPRVRQVSFRLGNSRIFRCSFSPFLPFADLPIRTIIVSTSREMKYLFSSSAFLSLDYYSYLSRSTSFSLSFFLSHIPLLTYKHAYKHTLAHTDTQKCPTNTHSRNFSELRYLDKNITAV